MPSADKTFRDLELLNVKIDVWIDEEENEEIYKCIKLDPESDVTRAIEEAFLDSSKFKPIFIDEKGNENNPENAIQCIGGIHNPEKKNEWKRLFLAKYLRAKIMEDGTDDYTKYLDDLVIYLQRKLPYQSPQSDQDVILQHLYFQELSACGKSGLESLGFGVQAYDLVAEKKGTGNGSHFNFELYKLWARLNQGIGFLHSEQKMDAALAFNEVIREFEDNAKCLQADEKGLWRSLLYDQAVLSRAELQEDLQFSYHTILTLKKLGERKREKRLIKEALAYRDMGRLSEAEGKIKKLLDYNSKKHQDLVNEAFLQFENWKIGNDKKGLWSATLGLLFDYSLQKFQEFEKEKQNDIKNDVRYLVDRFIHYKNQSDLLDNKQDRTSYYQQVARFLEWLSDRHKKAKKQKTFFKEQIECLYKEIRNLLPGIYHRQEKMDGHQLIKLAEFDKYEYDRFTNSMEKFFWNINKVKGYDPEIKIRNFKIEHSEDEMKFLDELNDFEREKHWLYKFKELERNQRIESLKPTRAHCEGKNLLECFNIPIDSSAFDGILNCAEKTKNKDNYDLLEYLRTDFKPLVQRDYEMVMRRENERFLDYLKFRSKHPSVPSAEKSYHFLGLQRWNSQTPTLTLSQGGGYFIYQQDAKGQVVLGIAIDPGFDFVDNLFHMGFTLYDIDFILISHAHLDHMRDFEPIISSLLDLKKRTYGNIKKKIHVMMSLGVYHKLEHVITNTTLREYLADTYIIDIDKKIEKEYLPPFRFKKDTMDDRSRKFVSVLDNEDSICEIEITPTKAYHNDYSEESDSFGYIIRFMDGDWKKPLFSFGYTGDTKWHKSIPGQYSSCDVICIHLGALIESEKEKDGKDRFSYYMGSQCEALIEKKGHPYLFGLLRFLKQIKETKNQNKLILISEFGEELKGGIRIDLIHRLNHILEDQDRVCLPVDIGLNLILAKKKNGSESGEIKTPNLVWCFGCERFVKAGKIGYKHFGYGRDEALFYFCETCLKSKPQNVIQDKMCSICDKGIPLQKAE